MNIRLNIPKLLIPIGTAALAVAMVMLAAWVAGLGWWADASDEPSGVIISMDMPVFESPDALSDVADVVVVATVSEIVGELIDQGEEEPGVERDPDTRGIPMLFYELDVNEILSGSIESTFILAKAKGSSFFDDDYSTDLQAGQTTLLFLTEMSSSWMLRADEYDNRFYVTVSMDNGVFDAADGATAMTDDTAFTPRMEYLFAQSSFTLGQVKQSVGVSDDSGQTGGPGGGPGGPGPGDGGGTQAAN